MSEKSRMAGIVVVFLVLGAGLWWVVSRPSVEPGEVSEGSGPSFGRDAGAVPEFEFDAVGSGGVLTETLAETETTAERETDPVALAEADDVTPEFGKISGQVISKLGRRPIMEFEFLLVNGEYSSDMDGDYKFYYPPLGKFSIGGALAEQAVSLRVRAKGYVEAMVPIEGIRGGETRSGVVIALESENVVTGRVIDYRGDPVEGAWVFMGLLPGMKSEWERLAIARSDAQGRIVAEGVPGGRRTFVGYREGFTSASVTTILEGGNTEIQFILGEGGTVTGLVTLAGVPVRDTAVLTGFVFPGRTYITSGGTEVLFSGSGSTDSLNSTSDENGRFRITGIPAGTGMIQARIIDEGFERNIRIDLEVSDGMTTEVNFPFLSANSSVEGYILVGENETGPGMVDLRVDTDTYTESRSTTVGSDGYYYFESVPPGRVWVSNSFNSAERRETVTEDLGVNEVLRLDLNMYHGTTIVCRISNAPNVLLVYARLIPEGDEIPEPPDVSRSFDRLTLLSGGGVAEQFGTATFYGVESGSYNVLLVAVSIRAVTQIVTSPVLVQDEAEIEVFASF